MAATQAASSRGLAMPARNCCLMIAIGAACAFAGMAEASIVHRCRGADGAVVYRDSPCAIGEATIDRREFEDAAPPATGSAEPRAAAGRAPARAKAPDRASAYSPPTSRGAGKARDGRIVAHECRFGEQRWVQAAACPRSFELPAPRGGKPVKRSVDETRLTAAQVCAALRGTSSADAPGAGSARRGYGMNRLRQLHGC
jgi:hypothetical protein